MIFLHRGIIGNKEPFIEISEDLVANAVAELVLAANQPAYIHCDKGKHRTGCVVGVYRRMLNWTTTAIFEESTLRPINILQNGPQNRGKLMALL